MKKIFLALLTVSLGVCICGCGQVDESVPDTDDGDDGFKVTYNSQVQSSAEPKTPMIERNQTGDVSAPEGSISFEEACEILDKCSMQELSLPQSVKDYKKYYFATVDYDGKKYYSIYPYVEKNNKKVFVGANCLVSCSGSEVLVKDWLGHYEDAEIGNASYDKELNELYPNAKATPNEAVLSLTEKKDLGLEYDLSKYTFEFLEETKDIQGINCFVITPKIEFEGEIKLSSKMYLNTDGSGKVYRTDPNDSKEYIELK